MRCLCLTVFWLLVVSPLTLADDNDAQVQEILAKADPAYGEYLSGQCVTCHHATGDYKGIPAIVGLQANYLVKSMLDYKNAVQGRTNPAMVNIAKNLSDEELGSLAQYLSEQQSK
ncbi:MAG: c-type cytochrome [Rhizobiaceae bacterium]